MRIDKTRCSFFFLQRWQRIPLTKGDQRGQIRLASGPSSSTSELCLTKSATPRTETAEVLVTLQICDRDAKLAMSSHRHQGGRRKTAYFGGGKKRFSNTWSIFECNTCFVSGDDTELFSQRDQLQVWQFLPETYP